MTKGSQPMTAKPKRSRKPKDTPAVVAYKGFDAGLSCKDFAFKIGETLRHDGHVEACASGFHACENPLDVWRYYGLGGDNRFCRVQLSGAQARGWGDSKIAAEIINIETEITLGEMIRAGVDYEIKAALAKAKTDEATIRSGQEQWLELNASSGYYATNVSSGDYARNASSGDFAKNASRGYYAKNASSGNRARNAGSGDYVMNASSGHYAMNASSGDHARNASSGGHATNVSSGDYATNASSGDHAMNVSSGDHSTNASSGHYAKNEATGERSTIAAAGLYSCARGAVGTAIALCYADAKGQIRFVCGVIGEDGLKPGTWYRAENGRLVEAQP